MWLYYIGIQDVNSGRVWVKDEGTPPHIYYTAGFCGSTIISQEKNLKSSMACLYYSSSVWGCGGYDSCTYMILVLKLCCLCGLWLRVHPPIFHTMTWRVYKIDCEDTGILEKNSGQLLALFMNGQFIPEYFLPFKPNLPL